MNQEYINRLQATEHLLAQGWQVQCTNSEITNFLVFDSHILTAFDGPSGCLTIGAYVDVPHNNNGCVKLRTAVQRTTNSSCVILSDKDSLLKVELVDSKLFSTQLAEAIKSVVHQMQQQLSKWVIERWMHLKRTAASLDECIKIVEMTDNTTRHLIDIDRILTAHNLVTPKDTWQMFKRQANTPYNRLDIINILAEYAMYHIDPDKKIGLMHKAGTQVTNIGDLESRPFWVAWDNIDLSNRKYFITGKD